MIAFSKSSRRGSALITVFWMIAVLGMVIFGAAKFVSVDSKWISGFRKAAYAERQAEIGLALGTHPQISAGDPILARDSGDSGSFVARITTEEALIPINQVLAGPNRQIVKRLFLSWGMDEQNAAAVVDALGDWVDPNDLVNLNGAERESYEAIGRIGMPFNRPFGNLLEMRHVIGMEQVELLKPDWMAWFTVYSSGQFDLNEANPDAIAAILGVPISAADAAVARRNGQDGIRGTIDDVPFTSVAEALQVLGIVGPAGTAGNFLTIQGPTRRIVSDGIFGDVGVRLVEVQDGGGELLWRGKMNFTPNF